MLKFFWKKIVIPGRSCCMMNGTCPAPILTPIEPRQRFPLINILELLVVLVLLFCLWHCLRYCFILVVNVYTRLRQRARRRDFLIKRCDQETTRNVEDRIIGRLQREYNVVERPWNKNLDDGQHPVIVFCVISSRIGTDIENAMRGVNGKSPVVLVLLHCVLSALLRGDLSDDEELLDPEMKKRMTGITHFAFSDREGLYSCHQNTVGFEQLIDIVRSLDG